MDNLIEVLARELGCSETHVSNVVTLIDEGATIPFIARYRKELHGSMDDQLLRDLADRLQYLRNLAQRKDEVKNSIENQGKLTSELSAAIDAAATLAEVEDLYRPYKQKRRTRATMAKEKGLEPLALLYFEQGGSCPDPEGAAAAFIDPEKGVETVEDAIQGACDIIAEMISDDAQVRKELKALYRKRANLVSKAAEKEPADSVYRLYYDFNAPISRVQGHQVLAINRGEKEELLKVAVELDSETARIAIRRMVVPNRAAMSVVRAAADDAYDRLLHPSLEREMRTELTDTASEGAIHNFALNLRPLLMQPPVKGKVTMGLDPGYRMGCKVAVVDGTGKVLDTAVVYPTHGNRQKEDAIHRLSQLIAKHKVVHIAIGNGTASRETEQMTVELIRRVGGGVSYAIVNEAGASVYSASKLAAEEFPEYDVNLRSAVSIARRLQDPLAELVKIDPKAIGVGQYQHDMPQARLSQTLDGVVEDCVNGVGVDLNTASAPLLTRVSGLNGTTAKNIVKYREENGEFTSRKQILKVPKLGPKAFEQCAGFLRVPESKSVLDNTGVHPESYAAAERLLSLCGYSLSDVKAGGIADLKQRAEALGLDKLASDCGVGAPTLADIIKELMKPGRDPREDLPQPILRTDVLEMKDLKPGMELQGTVRNVIDFGVFVDIGVHQDGLVHISRICDRFIKHPSEVLSVGDVVTVWVVEVDEKKKRIGLTMKKP
ncbi:MAG: RNA-binding transcriptional accessory protein [Oscillospiraceae bacterium]|nr:RNA-binding transcriptional accessory protein [Oscillospiraceae bacterium]